MPSYKPGDVVSAGLPLVHILVNGMKKKHCDYCFAEKAGMQNCSRCHQMFYCGKTCQRVDWKIHKHECEIYAESYSILRADHDRILLRLYLIGKYQPEKLVEQFDVPGVKHGEKRKRSYKDLMTHKEKVKEDPNRRAHFEMSFSRLQQLGIEFNYEELFEMFCKIIVNSYTAVNVDMNEIGVALFVLESVFNHSCCPNAAPIFNGVDFEVRVIREIADGEEITVNYIDLKSDTDARRKKLMNMYYFHCQCQRCETRKDDDIDYAKLNHDLAEMDECIDVKQSWQRALDLGEETTPLFIRIYGDHHPDLTVQLVRNLKLFLLLNDDLDNEAVRKVVAAKEELAITHGYNHYLYKVYREIIA